MGEWKQVELADLCTRVTSGGTPARSHPEYFATQTHGHPWVKSSELRDRHIGATEEQISDLGLQNSAAKLLPPETVLVAMYGATAGRVGLLDVEAALNQAICALVPDRDQVDPIFLFHTLRSKYDVLAGMTAGAAQQNLNAGIVKAFRLHVPSVATQSRIAAVLSSFDELIEINERRIELLEDLARSLYREWFVHFRFPGHESAEFVDLDGGPLPAEWRAGKLGDIADLNGKKVRASEIPDPFQYLDISSVGIGKLEAPIVMAAVEAPGRARRRASDGDVVWATVRPNRRSHALIHDPPSDLVVSTGLAVLTPVAVPSSFLFEYTASDEFSSHLIGRAGGAAYPAVRPDDFKVAPVLLPPQSLLERFDEAVDPILRSASDLRQRNWQFAATRDLLLPRFVSGQLDISDIDLGVLTPVETE